MNFRVDAERLDRLGDQKAYARQDEADKTAIEAVRRFIGDAVFTNRKVFDQAVSEALKSAGLKIRAPVRKAILAALSERDDKADICTDRDGNPEPDTDLRDHELVPLAEDWREYMKREVLPFVPDAWVDEGHTDARDNQVGRAGYEIDFNRYFYQYVPPRPLEEIDTELKALGAEIAGLPKEVTA